MEFLTSYTIPFRSGPLIKNGLKPPCPSSIEALSLHGGVQGICARSALAPDKPAKTGKKYIDRPRQSKP